ncbi:MAG: class I SAM-dependent rRNA methyltransferase [Bacteroidota bacterium]|nr:class I SAM-dependent rRNA methyltransferase [Bacteroidota bacterium]
MSFPILTLKPDRQRSLINRHPWVFSGAVQNLPKAETGDIIEVHDNKGQWLGYGFFDERSEIVCKIFEYDDPHAIIDQAYWQKRLSLAYNLRKNLLDLSNTNCFRLVHAEGDSLPGMIADVYDNTVVMQILHKGTQNILDDIAFSLCNLGFEYIYLKTKKSSKHIEDINLPQGWCGKEGNPIINVKENGLNYQVDIENGQKTGFFLDQRDNRFLLRQYSKNKSVLNAFCYTGGFSVSALKGDAAQITSVDISKSAVDACNYNMRENFGSDAPHTSFAADCFDYLRGMPAGQFDVIVLDPPAFAKHARAVPQASRGYKDINMLAIQKIKPGGIIFTFSCSKNIDTVLFRKIVFGAAADARRNVRIIHQLTQGVDHPINIYHPEGEYLKGLVLYIE